LVLKGIKRYEIRKNDRGFKVNDTLKLIEWDNLNEETTGRCCFVNITHILEGGNFGVEKGYSILSIQM